MKLLNICPCCSSPMLHHFNHDHEYWFCRRCWQEMPVLSDVKPKNHFAANNILNRQSARTLSLHKGQS